MQPHHFHYQMPPIRPNFFAPTPPQFPQPPQPFGFRPGPLPPPVPRNFPPMPKGATRLDTLLETANRFLATAQSFQPYIQQAAPMLRNLPALWKLYKGFQGIPSQGNEPREEAERSSRSERFGQTGRSQRPSYETRPSVPKIFQPPFDPYIK
ncbi:4-hydroxy-3-methylbut-2-enyl diphosphate reductase [Ureibacillus terrenus]|uniref:4-hydroxy-3-methylbut-2-enyl diphosphate reductase n=1 Tax=Ureibacillus terrenus TaxID=118246 RepID=A0A540V4T8_9BACL|nr:4-hydroxy-3-methylbut-2-enyl diphosphate reductase [Ureibacillus terrenus]